MPLGPFHDLTCVYIDKTPHNPPFNTILPAEVATIRWVFLAPEFYDPPQKDVCCFTDTPGGKISMIKWLLKEFKPAPGQHYGPMRKAALRELARLAKKSTVPGLLHPFDVEPIDQNEVTKVRRKGPGCSQGFATKLTQQNPQPPLLTPTERSGKIVKSYRQGELFTPPGINVPDLACPNPQAGSCNPTNWSKQYRSARIYDGALILYECPNFLGVMVTLLANGSDPNDPPKEYRDLSEVGFDQKAKSEQQV